MLVLGIETSCDDTGVAIVEDGRDILANVVSSQGEHARYGGVVPEIAARKHVENLPAVLEAALLQAGVGVEQVEGIAITRGPGLIGALLAGWCYGRGLARSLGRPYVGVHHLAAHVYGALMSAPAGEGEPQFPLLALVVSGGHTALYRMTAPEHFELVGQTRDDAAGEAFDKVAKLLGLGYPGGPVIDRLAATGDPGAYALPRADLGTDFSFSGLKTAVRRAALQAQLRPGRPQDPRVRGLVASFQAAVVEVLVATTQRALVDLRPRGLVLCGGVAANRSLGTAFRRLAARHDLPLWCSPRSLSTDNAAMIAAAGSVRLVRGESDPLGLPALARWPLAATSGGRGVPTAC